jgi:hypothetical protein
MPNYNKLKINMILRTKLKNTQKDVTVFNANSKSKVARICHGKMTLLELDANFREHLSIMIYPRE